jgi:hypothetical protein
MLTQAIDRKNLLLFIWVSLQKTSRPISAPRLFPAQNNFKPEGYKKGGELCPPPNYAQRLIKKIRTSS